MDAVVSTDGTAEVYNLTVDEAHTYFVGDGAWLVHNACPQDEFPFVNDIPEVPRQVDYPAIDPNRPHNSGQYTVVYEVKLPDEVPFSGMSREQHFRQANEALYNAMREDSGLYDALEANYPGLFSFVSPGKLGNYQPESPSRLGLTWHHRPMSEKLPEAGIMQLIPRFHHATGGAVRDTLHPLLGGGGGFQQWR